SGAAALEELEQERVDPDQLEAFALSCLLTSKIEEYDLALVKDILPVDSRFSRSKLSMHQRIVGIGRALSEKGGAINLPLPRRQHLVLVAKIAHSRSAFWMPRERLIEAP